MNSSYKICTKCVMDTTDIKIIFDKEGVCDHCNTFYRDILPFWHTDEKGTKALQEIIDKIKKEGEEKDLDFKGIRSFSHFSLNCGMRYPYLS